MDQPLNPWQVHSKWEPISRENRSKFLIRKGCKKKMELRLYLLDNDHTRVRRI